MFLTPNLVIGITIMAVGVALLLDTLGIRNAASLLKYWPALIVLFGASIVAQAFRPVTAGAGQKGNGGVPCFFLFLLGVAMFSFLGVPGSVESRGAIANVTGVLRADRVSGSADVRGGRVAAVMGRSSLDLRQVQLAPGEDVIVDVFVAMGNATIRIPDHWVVDASALPVMGSVEQERFTPLVPPADADGAAPTESAQPEADVPVPQPPAAGPPPRLRLRGVVLMGKVAVTS